MSDIHITEIKQTKKGRYALFCDGEFLFSVDEQTFTDHHLVHDMTLTEQQLSALRADSDEQKALRKALDFLALRDHASAELKIKLMRTFDEQTARRVVERVRDIGYLDDADFAKRYAQELIERRGASLREAQNKLWQKGIDRETIQETLAGYEGDETAQIKALIQKKYRAKMQGGNTQAVFAALARRGFSSRDIRAALGAWGVGIDDEEF